MVFSSHIFLYYFLPAFLLLYYLAPRRGRNLLLTLASYFFYGWANPLFMGLMLLSTLVDYLAGLAMIWTDGWPAGADRRRGLSKVGWRKLAVTASVCSNLSLLGFFKYFNFTVESYNGLMAAVGCPDLRLDVVLRVTLPLGISFYTFQSMSYIIDVYRGQAKPIRNFIDFACFVAMFPQLVAGPIIRFAEIADQLRQRSVTLERFARGTAFFSVGLTKKILLANPCGQVADRLFDAGPGACLDAWYGIVAYAFQIYFDFSGYSDMAIGLGLMLGFVFAKNFDAPYRADSLTDFWRRWHLSLSTWLRDYLYLPLGGNRLGARRTYLNLIVVMLLGGLWHGAAWTFVVWGGLHGAWLALERWGGKRGVWARAPRPLRVALTFTVVLLTWVFFRAPDLASALAYAGRMLGCGAPHAAGLLVRGVVYAPYYLATVAACALVVWAAPQTWTWTRRLTPFKIALTLLLLGAAVLVLNTQAYNPFIYFIF